MVHLRVMAVFEATGPGGSALRCGTGATSLVMSNCTFLVSATWPPLSAWASNPPFMSAVSVTERVARLCPSPVSLRSASWSVILAVSVASETTSSSTMLSPTLAAVMVWSSLVAVKDTTAATPDPTSTCGETTWLGSWVCTSSGQGADSASPSPLATRL